jgi:hypothetical protein
MLLSASGGVSPVAAQRIVATPYPYVVLYQVRAGEIVVRSIRHGARKGN